MSLVNGMLRDLDRRRDAPTRTGIGSERLVPVADAQRAAPLAAQLYPDSGDLAAAVNSGAEFDASGLGIRRGKQAKEGSKKAG